MKVFIYDCGFYFCHNLIQTLLNSDNEIYGTIHDKSFPVDEKVNIVDLDDSGKLIEILKNCELIVCHLFGNLNNVHGILSKSREHNVKSTFIAVSTVLTWSRNKFSEEDPLQEERYLERDPSPNEVPIKTLESQILVGGTDKLKTYILSCGMFYGNGEFYLNDFFKDAWLCSEEGVLLPLFRKEDENKIATVHVRDAVNILLEVYKVKPEKHYLICLDKGKYNLKEIISCISEQLGINRIRQWDDIEKENYLVNNRDFASIFQMNLDFNADNIAIKELEYEWTCESGIVENMKMLIKEFINAHRLFPQKIVVIGPPASGKSVVSGNLSQRYYIPHITTPMVIEYGKTNEDLSTEMADCIESAKDKRLTFEILSKLFKNYLKQPNCRNKGFVLDGYPRTYDEAKTLFGIDEEDEESVTEGLDYNTKLFPNSVVVLDDEDKILQKRLIDMPNVGENSHNNEAGFKRRIKIFRNNHKGGKDQSTYTFFEVSGHKELLQLKASLSLDEIYTKIYEYIENNNLPFNYHPTLKEIEDKDARELETKMNEEMRAEQEQKLKEDYEVDQRSEVEYQNKCAIDQMLLEDKQLLHSRSLPLQNYLLENIVPLLTTGIIDVLKNKPEDPIDYLAEWLFRNAPQ